MMPLPSPSRSPAQLAGLLLLLLLLAVASAATATPTPPRKRVTFGDMDSLRPDLATTQVGDNPREHAYTSHIASLHGRAMSINYHVVHHPDLHRLELLEGIQHVACAPDSLTITVDGADVAAAWTAGHYLVGGQAWGCTAAQVGAPSSVALEGDHGSYALPHASTRKVPFYRRVVSSSSAPAADGSAAVVVTFVTEVAKIQELFESASVKAENSLPTQPADAAPQPSPTEPEPEPHRRLSFWHHISHDFHDAVHGVEHAASSVWHGVRKVATGVYDAAKLALTGGLSLSSSHSVHSNWNYNTATGSALKADTQLDHWQHDASSNWRNAQGGNTIEAAGTATCSNCYVYLDAGYNFELDVSHYRLDTVTAIAHAQADLSIGIDGNFHATDNLSITKDVGTIPLGSFTFEVGPVPVTVSMDMPITMGALITGSFEGQVSFEASAKGSMSYGTTYTRSAGWQAVHEKELTHHVTRPGGDGSVTINIAPHLTLTPTVTLEHVLSVFAAITPFAQVNIDGSDHEGAACDLSMKAELGVDIKLGGGLHVDIMHVKLADHTWGPWQVLAKTWPYGPDCLIAGHSEDYAPARDTYSDVAPRPQTEDERQQQPEYQAPQNAQEAYEQAYEQQYEEERYQQQQYQQEYYGGGGGGGDDDDFYRRRRRLATAEVNATPAAAPLHADTNPDLSCPNRCSGHGACATGSVCHCATGYSGADCSTVASRRVQQQNGAVVQLKGADAVRPAPVCHAGSQCLDVAKPAVAATMPTCAKLVSRHVCAPSAAHAAQVDAMLADALKYMTAAPLSCHVVMAEFMCQNAFPACGSAGNLVPLCASNCTAALQRCGMPAAAASSLCSPTSTASHAGVVDDAKLPRCRALPSLSKAHIDTRVSGTTKCVVAEPASLKACPHRAGQTVLLHTLQYATVADADAAVAKNLAAATNLPGDAPGCPTVRQELQCATAMPLCDSAGKKQQLIQHQECRDMVKRCPSMAKRIDGTMVGGAQLCGNSSNPLLGMQVGSRATSCGFSGMESQSPNLVHAPANTPRTGPAAGTAGHSTETLALAAGGASIASALLAGLAVLVVLKHQQRHTRAAAARPVPASTASPSAKADAGIKFGSDGQRVDLTVNPIHMA